MSKWRIQTPQEIEAEMEQNKLKRYKKYVDEQMTNEDFLKDRMENWTLKEFEIYFGEENE